MGGLNKKILIMLIMIPIMLFAISILNQSSKVFAACTHVYNYLDGSCAGCGRYYSNSIEYCTKGCGSTSDRRPVTTTVAATCTTAGSRTKKCKSCSYVLSSTTIPATGHSYTTTTTAATCTTAGSTVKTCSNCGDSSSTTIPATGHSYTTTSTTAATCTTAGSIVKTCSKCNDKTTETIAATGHSYAAATCTAPRTCSACGATTGNSLGHRYSTSYSVIRTIDSCTTLRAKKCLNTGCSSYTESMVVESHSWGSYVETTAATCTTEGSKKRSCSACSDTQTATIAALGHNYAAATCTKPQTCTRCSATTGSANGHSWGSWTTVTTATCIKDGSEKRTCSVCSSSETRAVSSPGSHNYTYTTTAADCTTGSYKIGTCTRCSATTSSLVSGALGHSYATTYTLISQSGCDVTYAKKCTRSGCSAYTDSFSGKSHSYGSYTTTVSPTCTETGTKRRKCSRCSTYSYADVDALGHDMGDYYVVTSPTCVDSGLNRSDCQRSGCDYYEEQVTAAVGSHNYIDSCSTCGSANKECSRCTAVTQHSVSIPSRTLTFAYNGTTRTPIATGSYYTLSGTTSAINAGSYSVTVTLDSTSRHKWSDNTTAAKKYSWSITKLDINPVISMSGYTYGGTKSSPSVVSGNTGNGSVTWYYNTTNSNSGGTLWSNVTSPTSLNAGTYYMYAVIGSTTNYNGKTTDPVAFTIEKATGYITLSNMVDTILYLTEENSFTVATSHPGGTITATSTHGTPTVNGSTITVSGLGSIDVDTVITVTVTCNEATNYKAATATYSFKIVKIEGFVNLSATSENIKYGTDGTTFTVTNHHGGNLKVSTTHGTANITNGNTVTVSGLASLVTGTEVKVTVISETTNNYYEAQNTYTITIIKADITPVVSMEDYTYEGDMKEPSIQGVKENGNVTYYYNTSNSNSGGRPWSEVTDSSFLDARTYYMYATVDTTTNYNAATSDPVPFKINQTTGYITLAATEGTKAYDIDSKDIIVSKYHECDLKATTTHGSISISGGTVTVKGLKTTPAGTEVKVTITAPETVNHTAVSAEYKLTIIKADITPVVNMDDYTYDGTQSTPSVTGNPEKGEETFYYNTTNSTTGAKEWKEVTSSTYLNAGIYYMYATVGETDNYNGATTEIVDFEVKRATPVISLSNSTTRLVNGNTEVITYNYVGDGELSVSSTDDTKVDRVLNTNTNEIKITAKGAGQVTVTLSAAQGDNYLARTASIVVNIPEGNYNIDGLFYETLYEAYSSINVAEETITVVRSSTDNTPVTIANDKKISLDLNGNTITVDGLKSGAFITNKGTLDLADSKSAGMITMSATAPTGSIYVFDNQGILNLPIGTYKVDSNTYQSTVIKNTGTTNIDGATLEANNSATQVGDNSVAGILATSGTVNFNTGKITTTSTTDGTLNYGIINEATSKVDINITGGEIASNHRGILLKGNSGQASTLDISGGAKITGNGAIESIGSSNIVIEDATLTGLKDYGIGLASTATGSLNVYGGTITSENNGIKNDSNSAKIIIGRSSDAVVAEPPVIQGSVYGIYDVNGIAGFEFYDGTLKGQTEAYLATVKAKPDGYQVHKDIEASYKTALLRPILMERDILSVDSDATTFEEYQDKTDDGKLNTYYALGAKEAGETSYTSNKITSIKIIDTRETPAPTSYKASWDVTEIGDGRIMAWLVEVSTDQYELQIGSDGEIIAPINSKDLFKQYVNATEISGLTNLDAAYATDMNGMFDECRKVTNLDLSEFNSDNVTDMAEMFGQCYELQDTKLPDNFVTDKVTTMKEMFKDCNKLSTLSVGNYNTSKVTDMESVFANCNALTELSVSNWDTSSATTMNSMFLNCNNLATLNVTNFKTQNVTDMAHMFNGCNVLATIDVSNFNTSKVTNMESMFENCNAVTVLNVSNFNTNLVTDMSNMFHGCNNVAVIDVSKWNTANVTDMGWMFKDCSNLEAINVKSFNTSKVQSIAAMFYGCKKLKSIDFSSFDLSGLVNTKLSGQIDEKDTKELDYLVANCTSLNSVLLGKMFSRMNGVNMFVGCTALKAVIVQNETPITFSRTTGIKDLEAILYVPTSEAEAAYEQVTNYNLELGNTRIEPILELIGEATIDVLRSNPYVEEGVTVIGVEEDDEEEYTQYGYELVGPIITDNGVEVQSVDTMKDTTYKITYTLNYNGAAVVSVIRTVNIYRLNSSLVLSTKDITMVVGNKDEITYEYSGDGTINLTIDTNIATVQAGINKFILEAIAVGTTNLDIEIPATEYTDIVDRVVVKVLKENYTITKDDGTSRNYNTLQEAIDDAEDGDTITVLDDVTETGDIVVNKDVTIDLGDNKITTDSPIVIAQGSDVKIIGDENGTIENTDGTAIINNGTLTVGENKGTESEEYPIIEGKDLAIDSNNGTFNFDSATLIGKSVPPYTGEADIIKGYYGKIEPEGDKYKAIITKDNTIPVIYTGEVEEMICRADAQITIDIFIEEPDSKMNTAEFSKEDLVFIVGGVELVPEVLNTRYVSETAGTYRYEITFKGLNGNGDLVIKVPADSVFNIAKMGNAETTLVENKITIDHSAPDLTNATIEFVKPVDGITNDGVYEVKVSGVHDDNGISQYEWQIRTKGETEWKTIEKDYTSEGSSFLAGNVDEEGIYEIRVIALDNYGNIGYSEVLELTYEEITIVSSKPTIGFQKELVSVDNNITAVKIHAIIKSTSNIVSVTVDGVEVGIESATVEGAYQIRTDVVYEAAENKVYAFTVKDSYGNVATEYYNVTDINKAGATVDYEIIDATPYEPAKIVFTADKEVKLEDGLTPDFSLDDEYDGIYSKEIVIEIVGDIDDLDNNFVFEDVLGNEITIHVTGEVETVVRNIITVEDPNVSITDVYGSNISVDKANDLVLKMKNAKKVSDGTVKSYYGVDFTEINTVVSSQNQLNAASILGGADVVQIKDTQGLVTELQMGNVEILTSAEYEGAMTNKNKTGVSIGSGIVAEGGSTTGGSFHVTIINK